MRRAAWGVVVAAVYVAVSLVVPGHPTRPLYDAIGPQQPYQWVNPPPLYASTNKVPHGVTLTVVLTADGSEATSLATTDGQAALIIKKATFAPRPREKEVKVRIDPLDPATIGPPPSGQRYDGNAYRFAATYAVSNAEATLTQPATVVLIFPIVATRLYRRDGDVWTDLNATPVGASLQIFADTDKLGTFVATGLPLETDEKKKSFPTALVVSITAAAVAAIAAFVARMRARGRRARRGRPKGTKPAARRPPKRR